jgi:hypothetical protein
LSARTFLETEKLIVYRKIVFGIVTGRIEHNVLELPVVRFETVVYRNATNKDTMFTDFCKAKIIVFRGATAFAKALLSARITGRCC